MRIGRFQLSCAIETSQKKHHLAADAKAKAAAAAFEREICRKFKKAIDFMLEL